MAFFVFQAIDAHADTLSRCDEIGSMLIDPYRVGIPVEKSEYKPKEVAKACREALELEPNNPRYHFQLGVALMAMGDSDSVKHMIDAADANYAAAIATLFILDRKINERLAKQQNEQ